jgi:DNA-binding winged helix-turn-helix (wHTH) protein/tetratricopeptide (TPR) repeat protein
MTQEPLHLRFGRFELDERSHALLEDGRPVAIGPKPLAILFHLARHRDRVVRRDELLRAVWPDTAISDDAIWQSLFKVRSALGDEGPSRIQTVRGVGFRFRGEVQAARGFGEAAPPVDAVAGGGLTGRAQELAVLRAALGRAAAGAGGLLLVVGEPGIGKTRLAEALLAEARRAGHDVHEARGREERGAPAFWLWAQVLRSCAETWDAGRIASAIGSAAGDLARIAPELRGAIAAEPAEALDAEERRFRMFDALCGFLRRAARRTPQVILLDDLQWADSDSLDALAFLGPEIRRERVLVLATVRDHDLARHEVLQDAAVEFAKNDALVRVTLRGLEPADVALLAEQARGERLPEGAIALLRDRAAGNPFFIRQMLALLPSAAEPAGRQTHDDELEALGVPTGVQRVASKRLANLSAPCREVLEVAAVIGTEFSYALLAQSAGQERTRLIDALDEGKRHQIVSSELAPESRWRFRHDLLREVLYEELPGTRRAAIHRAVAEALEKLHAAHLPPVVPALARHYGAAALLQGEFQAVDYAKWAGDLALAATAHGEAAAHFERALEALALGRPAPRRRAELLVALGLALQSAGRTTRARSVLAEAAAAARDAAEPLLFAVASLGIAQFFMTAGDATAIALLREALAALPLESTDLHVRLRAALAVQLAILPGRHGEAESLAAEAEATARRVGSPRALAEALLATAFVERQGEAGRPEARAARAAEAREAVRGLGETTLEVIASLARHGALLEMGDRARADLELDRIESLVARLRSAYWRNLGPRLRAGRALLDGRFDEAEPLAVAGFGVAEEPEDPHSYVRAVAAGAVRYEQGRGAELLELIEAAQLAYPDEAGLRVARTFALVQAGRTEEARDELEALLASDLSALVGSQDWTFALALLGIAASELEHEPAARVIYGLLEPRASAWVVVGNGRYCVGPVSLHLALLALTLGDVDAAERHLALAREHADAMRSPPWRAHVLAALALASARRGTLAARRRARGLAREARAIAEPLGMHRLLRRIEAAAGDLPG